MRECVALEDLNGDEQPAIDIGVIDERLEKLQRALESHRSKVTCLRRWSEFVRQRDGHRCVDCYSEKNLSAHHICRKVFMEIARYDTGNGITLCRECHKDAHAGFNRCPNTSLPIDVENGEKLALMERYFSILVDDACSRNILFERYYWLDPTVLNLLKRMQGYDPNTPFPGAPIEQAYLILAETEMSVRDAIASANGIVLDDRPRLPGGIGLGIVGPESQSERLTLQSYRFRI